MVGAVFVNRDDGDEAGKVLLRGKGTGCSHFECRFDGGAYAKNVLEEGKIGCLSGLEIVVVRSIAGLST